MEKLVIIGSGPAGCTAAVYAARANLKPTMVHGLQPGGQMTITTDVENYPGFADVIQGPWLMEQMQKQAEHVGTRMMWDTIVDVDVSNGSPFTATGDSGDEYVAVVLVIATGAQAKWLGVPGEQELGGKGVSACATCDGFFYRGKKVAVIGTGCSAVQLVPKTANKASHLTILQRTPHWISPNRDYYRAVEDGIVWALNHLPLYAEWHRARMIFAFMDTNWPNVPGDPAWPQELGVGQSHAAASRDATEEGPPAHRGRAPGAACRGR